MQMNDHTRRGWPALMLALLLFFGAAQSHPLQANTESEPPAKTDPPMETGRGQPPESGPDTRDSGTPENPEQSSASGVQPVQVKPFKPTESIEADSAVSFPIDI